jgi:sugar phosphate permease
MQGAGGLHAWQWLFIVEGLITVVVAIAAIFILADYPGTTRWLSEEEKTVAVARLALDIGSEESLDEQKVSAWQSIVLAAKDYRTWMFACMQMSTTASISYSHFFPTLIKELGFTNNTTTLLLTSPPYCAAVFWALGCAWYADRKQIRSPLAATSACLAIIGGIASAALPRSAQWPKYGMLFFMTCGTYGIYTTTYTWLSSTLARPPAKRAAVIGLANTFANLASFYGNYFWLDKYEPEFTESWSIIVAFLTLGLTCILALRFILSRTNKKFDRLAEEYADRTLMDDLSEEEVRAVRQGFRYVL